MNRLKSKWLRRVLCVCLLLLLGLFSFRLLRQAEQAEAAHRPRRFGATYMTMNNPYFVVLNESIEEVVESNGDILMTRDPLYDQEKQNAQIQEMLDAGVDAIFINPVDWLGVIPALEKCKEAGVPVFNVDTYVYDSDYVVSSILSDNYDAGVQIARDILEKRKSARIVILNHDNINSTNLRVQGFLDVLDGRKEYQVVMSRTTIVELERAMETMQEILETGIQFDVVLGGNDPTALGALAAMQMAHLDQEDILLYGIDGSPDGKTMIKEGYMEGSSAQRPIEIGTVAAETAYRYLDGEQVDSNIIVPVVLITQENLNEFDLAGWQ